MRRDVRIVLVGDEGVGKSTIITTLIKESYVPHVQHIVPEVAIPPEVTSDNVVTSIIDCGAGTHDKPHLEAEVRKAHVICVVYAIDMPQSFDRIAAWWLPYLRSLGVNVPVILVGNKIDLREGRVTNQALEDEVIPIMNEFKEVESCIECSAKTPVNVPEVFFLATRAVLHPTAPLYDSRDHVLKPACKNALKRIFKLCDVNRDGILDNTELDEMQRKCFDTPLQLKEVEGIKDMVRSFSPSAVKNDGLTEAGFLYLHTIFIRKGRLETTWTVLRRFGYAEDLKLKESFLNPRFDVPYDCSVELSPLAYKFLTELFEVSDKDRDGALDTAELDDIFSTSPGNPWANQQFPDSAVTDDHNAMTLQGWLAQWSMTALLDHRTTLAYMAYLGFPSTPLTSALTLTRPRRTERRRGRITRNVFLCYVCGASGSGKSALLRSFVGKPFRTAYEPTTKPLSVVNSVEVDGAQKYLVLQEFGSKYEAEMLRSSRKLEAADLIAYVHDSSDTNSFSYISNLRQQYALDHIPALFIATKSDLDLALQRHEVQPDVYCRRLGLQGPLAVSTRAGNLADVFQMMCKIGMDPARHTPGGPDKPLSLLGRVAYAVRYAATTGGVMIGFLIVYRVFWRQQGDIFDWPLHWMRWLTLRRGSY